MPKTAGSSLRDMMTEWFDITTDYRPWWGHDTPATLDLTKFAPGQMLAGHFATDGMPLTKRYPDLTTSHEWRRISFVRDPLELALSWYFFESESRPTLDPSFKPVPLSQYLSSYPGMFLRHFECTEATWRHTIDRYWFIGTQERFADSVMCLAKLLGKPVPHMLTRNVTKLRQRPAAKDVEIFVKNMALEFEIYREIELRLEKNLGAAGFQSHLSS
jgi:hypothetical protein